LAKIAQIVKKWRKIVEKLPKEHRKLANIAEKSSKIAIITLAPDEQHEAEMSIFQLQ
jgi:hypothetical protein